MDWKIVFLGIASIFFGLALFGLNANALSLVGSCDSTSVQCDLRISNLTVCNDEPFAQTIVPGVSGNVPSWIRVLPESVYLMPGDCESLEVYTIAPCYEEPGNYSASVFVNGASMDSVSCDIEINQGHFVDVEIVPRERTVSQCEAAEYGIVLTNNTIVPNQEQELVNLSIGGIDPSWVNLGEFQAIVEKGEPKTVDLSLTSACMQEIGDYGFEIKASLFNPNFFSIAGGNIVIIQGQSFDIEPQPDSGIGGGTGTRENPFRACIEREASNALTIVNTGERDDTLKLGLSGPEWIRLAETEISVREGEEKQVSILFDKSNAEPGTYEFEVTFTSSIFSFSEKRSFFVSLRDCYNALAELPEGGENVCKETQSTVQFVVKNDRENPITLNATVEGIEAVLSEQSIGLSGFEEKTIEMTFDSDALLAEGSVQRTPVSIEVLFDASASMKSMIDSQRKIDIAKKSVIGFTKSISRNDLGLRVFGHRDGCSVSELVEPIGPSGMDNIAGRIKSIEPLGKTPLAAALEESALDFSGLQGGKFIIVVSDGKESCGGNVAASAEKLRVAGIKVFAIGFDIDQTGKTQLESLVGITGGRYFDASNSQELSQVFAQITKDLEIELSPRIEKNFSLKLESEFFLLEKDFTLNISDCDNVVVLAPQASLCSGVQSKDFITLTNIGTKAQSLSLSATPEFAALATSHVDLAPGQTTDIEVTFNPKAQDAADSLRIIADNGEKEFTGFSPVAFLGEEACFGFEMIVLDREFVGRIGEGERRKILFINAGRTGMNISIEADKPWVYFEPGSIHLEESGVGFMNYYITPPFDFELLKEDATAVFTASNEFGQTVEKPATLIVTGPSFGLVPEHIEVKKTDISSLPEEFGDKDFEISFELSNESDRTIEIRSITIPGYDAAIAPFQTVLRKGENTRVSAFVGLGGKTGVITLPLVITTTDGSIAREVTVDATPLPEPGVEEPQDSQAGLVFLGAIANGLIILASVVAVLLLLYAFFRKGKPKQAETFSKAPEEKTEGKQMGRLDSLKEKISKPIAGRKETVKKIVSKPAKKQAVKKTVKKKK
ncbi:MAG: VWA domain-containing protein [Candidatus Diapherotrites archaeon]|nr:VWA domain-containing protein [Candidatus Diapherotrites archaeon]